MKASNKEGLPKWLAYVLIVIAILGIFLLAQKSRYGAPEPRFPAKPTTKIIFGKDYITERRSIRKESFISFFKG